MDYEGVDFVACAFCRDLTHHSWRGLCNPKTLYHSANLGIRLHAPRIHEFGEGGRGLALGECNVGSFGALEIQLPYHTRLLIPVLFFRISKNKKDVLFPRDFETGILHSMPNICSHERLERLPAIKYTAFPAHDFVIEWRDILARRDAVEWDPDVDFQCGDPRGGCGAMETME